MARVDNWPIALNDYIRASRGAAFAWGAADCCQFIAGAIQAVTGDDLRALFPAYVTEEQAQAILIEHGGLAGLISHALGDPLENLASMGRGDICLVRDANDDLCCGVCTGADVFSADPRRGPVPTSRQNAVMAWRVG